VSRVLQHPLKAQLVGDGGADRLRTPAAQPADGHEVATPRSGLEDHACISLTTASVIREMVSLAIEAP